MHYLNIVLTLSILINFLTFLIIISLRKQINISLKEINDINRKVEHLINKENEADSNPLMERYKREVLGKRFSSDRY